MLDRPPINPEKPIVADVGDGVIIPPTEDRPAHLDAPLAGPTDSPRYSMGEKMRIVREVRADMKRGKKFGACSTQYGVSPQSIRNWMKEFPDETLPQAPSHAPEPEKHALTIDAFLNLKRARVAEAIAVIQKECDSCIVIAEHGSTIYSEIKGSVKQYEMLQAFISLRAMRDFKREVSS
jgi:transposase-like protein